MRQTEETVLIWACLGEKVAGYTINHLSYRDIPDPVYLTTCLQWLIFHFSGISCSSWQPNTFIFTHNHTDTYTKCTQPQIYAIIKVSYKCHTYLLKKSELVQEERKMSRFQESYYFSAEREIASDCDLWDKVLSLFLWDAISHGTFITSVLSVLYYFSCCLLIVLKLLYFHTYSIYSFRMSRSITLMPPTTDFKNSTFVYLLLVKEHMKPLVSWVIRVVVISNSTIKQQKWRRAKRNPIMLNKLL